jgi:hypothetical protein
VQDGGLGDTCGHRNPALFMPTGGLPRILRSSARVFLS